MWIAEEEGRLLLSILSTLTLLLVGLYFPSSSFALRSLISE